MSARPVSSHKNMHRMPKLLTIDSIGRRISPVMKKHGVNRALVFGSYARGTNDQHSDIDLMVVMATAKRFLDRIAEFEELYDELPGVAIDILVYTPEELERISHRPFVQRMLTEGITVYEQ